MFVKIIVVYKMLLGTYKYLEVREVSGKIIAIFYIEVWEFA